MAPTKILELKQLVDEPPAGLQILICSPATFDYYIAAMKELGTTCEKVKDLEESKSKFSDGIEVRTSDRLPLGILAAYDRNGKPLCAYRVPFK